MNLLITILLLLLSFWFTYTDLKSRVIPNKITHWAILVLLIVRVANPEFYLGLIPAVLLFIIWYVSPASLGAGDIKLFAIVGLGLGLSETITVLFWTLLLSSCVFYLIRIIKRKRVSALPLAPMITAGIVLSLILEWQV